MSTATAISRLTEVDVHQMSLQQLAARHPRPDLIPPGVNPIDTPVAYRRLRAALEEFVLGQAKNP